MWVYYYVIITSNVVNYYAIITLNGEKYCVISTLNVVYYYVIITLNLGLLRYYYVKCGHIIPLLLHSMGVYSYVINTSNGGKLR